MHNLSSPKAMVFDMDGTLLESERLARRCFLAACADVGWAQVDVTVYDRCVGTTYEATRAILRDGLGPAFPIDAMEERWSQRYHAHIRSEPLPRKPGVEALIARLYDAGIPLALATSSQREVTEIKLRMTGLLEFFDTLVCSGEAEQGKPHPAPYLKAAHALGHPPADCWALEDSDIGVRSAHAAGFQVIQVPDMLAPSASTRALGHPILVSAEELLVLLD